MARLGKVAYGVIFVAALPLLLWAWAHGAARSVPLPAWHLPVVGAAIAASSLALVIWGWIALMLHGGGLPMNAFPPPRYVARGPYRFLAHPIYVGFCGAVLGIAVFTGSASGLWLVFPTCALGSTALVHGYERPELLARFGRVHRPWIALPTPEAARPTRGDRVSAYLLVILPWGALYETLALLGAPRDATSTALPFESSWPVMPWTEAIYATAYLGVLIAPLLVRTRADLRRLCVRALLAMALVFPLYLALPLVAPQRPFVPTDALGRLLTFERAMGTPACGFPSFHAIWALLVAEALAPRTRLAWLWAGLVAVSCVTTGMHTVADVLGAAAVVALVRRADRVWELLRGAAERVANSWREWRLGPVRFISHGLWAGAGTTLGLAVIGAVLGPHSASMIAALGLGGLLGAGLWAQAIEGASGLSRPYGFYGGMLGMALVALGAPWFGHERWVALAACAVSAPFVQSLGRLRCLVQGCCHGSACASRIGIRHHDPHSRVRKVPELFHRPVHPTPLYSILWNIPIALSMVRLAGAGAPAHLVGGIYLVLGGLGRFVEESFRGEPQTPVVGRLRLYQWTAILSVVAGVLVSGFGNGAHLSPAAPSGSVWLVAALCGIVSAAALGVDFPESNRRFSRLT